MSSYPYGYPPHHGIVYENHASYANYVQQSPNLPPQPSLPSQHVQQRQQPQAYDMQLPPTAPAPPPPQLTAPQARPPPRSANPAPVQQPLQPPLQQQQSSAQPFEIQQYVPGSAKAPAPQPTRPQPSRQRGGARAPPTSNPPPNNQHNIAPPNPPPPPSAPVPPPQQQRPLPQFRPNGGLPELDFTPGPSIAPPHPSTEIDHDHDHEDDDDSNASENDEHNDDEDSDDGEVAQDHTYRISPPPVGEHKNLEACMEFIHTFTKARGYDLVKSNPKRSKKAGTVYRYTLKCSRGGKLKNSRKLKPDERQRLKRGSTKIGCSQGIIIAAESTAEVDGKWIIRYQEGDRSSMHNHPPQAASELPGHRKRERALYEHIIHDSWRNGTTPGRTLASIRALYPDASITSRDISNIHAALKASTVAAGLPPPAPPPKAILAELEAHRFFFRWTNDPHNHMNSVFLVTEELLEKVRRDPSIVLFEGSYRTDRNNRVLQGRGSKGGAPSKKPT